MGMPWSMQERLLLTSRYSQEGSLSLARELRRTPDSVTSQARRYGLSSPGARKRQAATRVEQSRSVDVGFFSRQTPAVAFALGLVWACGTVKTKHRHVLRMTLPTERGSSLRQVRELMECRHSIQTYEHTVVLEVSNTLLVHSLLRWQGMPPKSADVPQPPRLPANLIAKFASGHLAATSRRTGNHVHWRGPHVVMEWLADAIKSQAGVPHPEILARTRHEQTIRWQKIPDVRAIETWLGVTG